MQNLNVGRVMFAVTIVAVFGFAAAKPAWADDPAGAAPEAPAPPPALPLPNPVDLPAGVIAWDSVDKSITVDFGEPDGNFVFAFTNVSASPVTVLEVKSSCFCTAVKVPTLPWVIPAGAAESFGAHMDLKGKMGTLIKTVTFGTDKGTKYLLARCTINPQPASTNMTAGEREVNVRLAQADRQAVFRRECVSCHVTPAKDKMGKELFTAACGICHEAEHRATMVPDLKVAKVERNEDYWRNWITNGKQNSMMPAFAQSAGGILNDAQISSLVDYLAKTMPSKPTAVVTPAPSNSLLQPPAITVPPAH